MSFETIEGYISEHLRIFITMAVVVLALVGIVAISVFFIFIRGEEQTMVPDVQGKELTSALLELQVKELYPRIQLRFTQSSTDRGYILEQSPPPGTIVKAGRRIQLVVSQGVMINTVENFIGRNVDDVRMDIQAMYFAQGASLGNGSLQQLLSIREPLMFEFSSEAPGTILQQRPEPGSPISGPTVLEFVVSRGSDNIMIQVPDLLGLSIEDALEQIGRTGIDFEFALRPVMGDQETGIVVAQNPIGDTTTPSDTRVTFIVSSPETMNYNEVFGIFTYPMAMNPYPLLVQLESITPAGERHRLLSVQFAGGLLTVPYRQPLGSVLVLTLINREIHRETITAPLEITPVSRF